MSGHIAELHLQTELPVQAVQQLFESMLEMRISQTSVGEWSCLGPVVGVIHLTGGWDGFVLTGFEPSLAQVVAARMLAIPDPNDEDLRDAVGEIANILAGNLKCLIPESTAMSMPVVIEGTVSRKMHGPPSSVSRVYFNTEYGKFWLTMVPSGPNAGFTVAADELTLCAADTAEVSGQADSTSD